LSKKIVTFLGDVVLKLRFQNSQTRLLLSILQATQQKRAIALKGTSDL
jgi:hypothetical protein